MLAREDDGILLTHRWEEVTLCYSIGVNLTRQKFLQLKLVICVHQFVLLRFKNVFDDLNKGFLAEMNETI